MPTFVYHQEGVVVKGNMIACIQTLLGQEKLTKIKGRVRVITTKSGTYTLLTGSNRTDLAACDWPMIDGCDVCVKNVECSHAPESQLIMTDGYSRSDLERANQIHVVRQELYRVSIAQIDDSDTSARAKKQQLLDIIESALVKPYMVGRILVIQSDPRTDP